MPSLNGLQITLLWLLAIFFGLLIWSRRFAWLYARYVTLILVGCVMLLPFVWLVAAAFKDPGVLNEFMFFPPPSKWSAETMNLKNYQVLFTDKETAQGPVSFWRYVGNSLFLSSAGTVLTLFFSSLGGYALAKYDFRGKRATMAFMLGSLTIPGALLLAPSFELIYRLGWMDTYRALLIPGATSVFGIFLFRQAAVGVPDDIIEAGRIDGCSEFRIYLQLVMPLVRPMIGAFCLVSFLGAWNSFLGPNIFIQTQAKLPLPVILNQYVGEFQQQFGVFLAGTLLAILPPAILFFALQKEFVSGLTQGAVKG